MGLLLGSSCAVLIGCGGGSPADVLLPEEVSVTLVPTEPDLARGVALELAAVSGPDVGIQVTAVGVEDATGVVFEIVYDPALLEFTGTGPGTFFTPAGAIGAGVVEASPGRLVGLSAGRDQQVGRSGSGTLLTLQFRLRQLRDAQSQLTFAQPQSLVYGPGGVLGAHTFSSARIVTSIRAPR